MKKQGIFVVSLDFELFWGHVDKLDPMEHLGFMKVHQIVPRLCELFEKYEIHATWGVVGGILAHNDEEFLEYLPHPIPLQTQNTIERLGIGRLNHNACPKKMIYAPDLFEIVANTANQEVATHTYSHYYTQNLNSSVEEFEKEIQAARLIMKNNGVLCKTIIFPRNQDQYEYTQAAYNNGIYVFRGSHEKETWIYRTKRIQEKMHLAAPIWVIDNFFPISKSTYPVVGDTEQSVTNVKSSRMFKPYNRTYGQLEHLKIKRYKKEMLTAAQNKEVYHIWFHPFNFIDNTDVNLIQLEELFSYYKLLEQEYDMKTFTMLETAEYIKENR